MLKKEGTEADGLHSNRLRHETSSPAILPNKPMFFRPCPRSHPILLLQLFLSKPLISELITSGPTETYLPMHVFLLQKQRKPLMLSCVMGSLLGGARGLEDSMRFGVPCCLLHPHHQPAVTLFMNSADTSWLEEAINIWQARVIERYMLFCIRIFDSCKRTRKV